MTRPNPDPPPTVGSACPPLLRSQRRFTSAAGTSAKSNVQMHPTDVEFIGEVGRSEFYRHPKHGELRAADEWISEATATTFPHAIPPGPVLVRRRPEDPDQTEFKPLTKVPDGTYERLLQPEPAPLRASKPMRVSPGVRSGITTRGQSSGWCRDIDELDRLLAKADIEVRPTRDPNYIAGYGPGGRIINDYAALIEQAAPLYVARFAGDRACVWSATTATKRRKPCGLRSVEHPVCAGCLA